MEQKRKDGFIVLCIGRMGTGKSPIIKQFANNSGYKQKIVFDIRDEYPGDWIKYKRGEFEQMKVDVNYYEDSIIVFEEATAFFSGYNKMDFMEFITGIQHNNCMCFMAFHKVTSVPQYLVDLSRYILLFPVGDNIDDIKKHDKRFIPYLEGENKIQFIPKTINKYHEIDTYKW